MRRHATGKRLTIFVGEYDRYHHRPLAQAILERAREEGLAGATMTRGIEGFGSSGRLKTTRLLSSSDGLPIVIDIVDEAHRIETFLAIVEKMVTNGLVTVEDVDMQVYGGRQAHPLDDDPIAG
ncbi:MAG TPA: DUF190 domain-containing protein [Acidimicrobiales bacterium]|jgi:hypothetical protein|nr:DUF190 domain-containing protein [Acidimicrobiales bacterium]